MVSTEMILANLQSEASRYWLIAAIQHAALPIVILLAMRSRLGASVVAVYLGVTALVVATLAVVHSLNAFDGAVFAVLGLALILGRRQGSLHFAQLMPRSILGYVALVTGYWYPHFVDSAPALLVRSPYGLLPCPTLLVVLGMAWVAGIRFGRRAEWILAVVGLFYGITGVTSLHVLPDWPLVVMAVAYAVRLVLSQKHVQQGVLYEPNQG